MLGVYGYMYKYKWAVYTMVYLSITYGFKFSASLSFTQPNGSCFRKRIRRSGSFCIEPVQPTGNRSETRGFARSFDWMILKAIFGLCV